MESMWRRYQVSGGTRVSKLNPDEDDAADTGQSWLNSVPDVALLGNSGLEIKPGCGHPAYYRFLEIRFRKKDHGRGTETTPTTGSERSALYLLGRFEERVAAGFMRG